MITKETRLSALKQYWQSIRFGRGVGGHWGAGFNPVISSEIQVNVFIPPKGVGPDPLGAWIPGGMVSVDLPSKCPTCGGVMLLSFPGSSDMPGAFAYQDCRHFWSYDDVHAWLESQDKPTPLTQPVAKNVMFDTRCKHCGESNPYVETPPGGYSCYSCRSSGRK
jgi:hypothetical protein